MTCLWLTRDYVELLWLRVIRVTPVLNKKNLIFVQVKWQKCFLIAREGYTWDWRTKAGKLKTKFSPGCKNSKQGVHYQPKYCVLYMIFVRHIETPLASIQFHIQAKLVFVVVESMNGKFWYIFLSLFILQLAINFELQKTVSTINRKRWNSVDSQGVVWFIISQKFSINIFPLCQLSSIAEPHKKSQMNVLNWCIC